MDWTIDSCAVYVDGVGHTIAGMQGQHGSTTFWYSWDCSAVGNPSQHSTYATARLWRETSGGIEWLDLDSRDACQDGSPVYFIVADLHVKWWRWLNSYALKEDSGSYVRPSGQDWDYEWDLSGAVSHERPCAYRRNTVPEFRVTLHEAITGSAPMGLQARVTATPGVQQSVALFDNLGGAPAGFSTQTFYVTSTGRLHDSVALYRVDLTALSVLVQFTSPATQTWCQVSWPDDAGQNLYATLEDPVAPMAEPWVRVLADACTWAETTSGAAAATGSCVDGAYSNCEYNGGTSGHASYDTIYLKDWYEGWTDTSVYPNLYYPAKVGQCDDFADFLACLSNALGAEELSARRGYPSPGGYFETDFIVSAPGSGYPTSVPWSYHQWGTVDDTVWDASLRSDSHGAAKGIGTNTYVARGWLVLQTSASDCVPATPFAVSVVDSHP